MTLQSYIAFGNVAVINDFFSRLLTCPRYITYAASVPRYDHLLDMRLRRWGVFGKVESKSQYFPHPLSAHGISFKLELLIIVFFVEK